MTKDGNFTCIGVGNMGRAIVKGIRLAGIFAADKIVVSDVAKEKERSIRDEFGVKIARSNAEAVREARIVFLAVKPQDLHTVAEDLRPALGHKPLVITILAGEPISKFLNLLGEDIPVVRAMPNLPALVHAGFTAVAAGPNVDQTMFNEAKTILGTLGEVMEMPEDLLNAVTALSGSGPGFLFRLIEAFAEAGTQVGFDRDVAVHLVTQTFYGAAKLLVDTGETAPVLRQRVSSPGGTTLAGLKIMEEEGIDDLITKVVIRARDRAKELGAQ